MKSLHEVRTRGRGRLGLHPENRLAVQVSKDETPDKDDEAPSEGGHLTHEGHLGRTEVSWCNACAL